MNAMCVRPRRGPRRLVVPDAVSLLEPPCLSVSSISESNNSIVRTSKVRGPACRLLLACGCPAIVACGIDTRMPSLRAHASLLLLCSLNCSTETKLAAYTTTAQRPTDTGSCSHCAKQRERCHTLPMTRGAVRA